MDNSLCVPRPTTVQESMSILDQDPSANMLFAAMATHDLREPLQAIQSFVSVMLGERVGPINDIQRDFLNTIYLAGRRLERLIQDIYLIVTHDQGFVIEPGEVVVREQLEACCRELTPLADGYGLRFETTFEGRTTDIARLDPLRFDQIVLNLLENAMRYGARNTTVRIRTRQTRRRLLVLVSNQVDYPITHNPREWFTPFYREKMSRETVPIGRGLGLSVVAYLVSQHGGHVIAQIKGNTVTLGFIVPSVSPDLATESSSAS